MEVPELVVLSDTEGNPIGTCPKELVHSADTPLHLAFSCYVKNTEGQLLLTRRSLIKQTWPGVWTNSACGHLAPGETAAEAAARRVPHELGFEGDLGELTPVIPDFRYRATDSRGVVEWEICPVFMVTLPADAKLNPEPEEIDSFEWVDPRDLITAVDACPVAFSPWMVEQLSDPRLREALLG